MDTCSKNNTCCPWLNFAKTYRHNFFPVIYLSKSLCLSRVSLWVLVLQRCFFNDKDNDHESMTRPLFYTVSWSSICGLDTWEQWEKDQGSLPPTCSNHLQLARFRPHTVHMWGKSVNKWTKPKAYCNLQWFGMMIYVKPKAYCNLPKLAVTCLAVIIFLLMLCFYNSVFSSVQSDKCFIAFYVFYGRVHRLLCLLEILTRGTEPCQAMLLGCFQVSSVYESLVVLHRDCVAVN